MVSVKKLQVDQASKKKRVTFSVCADESDRRLKVPRHRPNDISSRLSTCVHKDSECSNKSRDSAVISRKKTGKPEAVKTSRKVCDVKKTLVRNVEQAQLPHCALVRRRPPLSIPVDITLKKPVTDSKASCKSKYAEPELYTALCIAKEIQDIARTDAKRPSGSDIPPAAKQMLDVKILSKLNFPSEEKLYKDLVSLTLCDEELLGSDDRPGSRREVEFRQCKDQEPQLTDFCAPLKGKEYNMVVQPPPCRTEKIRKYNGFTLYERCQAWFCND